MTSVVDEMFRCRSVRALCTGLVVLVMACADPGQQEPDAQASSDAPAVALEVTEQPADSVAFEEKMAWARENRLETLPIGESIAKLGRTFVGMPYTPGTLEVEGDERLVINLRELDCVTFVENVLAMARIIRAGTPDYASFKQELARIRYRDGRLDGYPSRLHYFSEWIANNQAMGIVEDITRDLGGVADTMSLFFMTTNRDAYRQLSDPTVVEAIRAIEVTLSGHDRYYIPEGDIAAAAPGIQDGDIIGATSTLPGLDVAHTGFALMVDGRLHLMHAPLVGSVVEISEIPLADRIVRIGTQDGVMVARPL